MSLNRICPFVFVVLIACCWGISPAATLIQKTSSEDQKTESAKTTEKDSTDAKKKKDSSSPKSRPQPEKETREERRERLRDRAQNSMGSVTNLISIPQIQRELDLTDDQRKVISDQVKSMQIWLRMQFREVQKLPRSEQAARIRQLKMQTASPMKAKQREILDILTEEQQMRLTGISMQYRGVECLLDDKIADLLELTEEQREELLNIAEEVDLALAESRTQLTKSKPEDRRQNRLAFAEKQKKLRRAREEKMLAVLTDEQRKKFEELQGKKFRARTPKVPTPIRPPEEPDKKESTAPSSSS